MPLWARVKTRLNSSTYGTYLNDEQKPTMENCNPRDASSKHANAPLMPQGYTNQGRNRLMQRNMGTHCAKLSCGLRQVVAS
jgi:hypothetical protein